MFNCLKKVQKHELNCLNHTIDYNRLYHLTDKNPTSEDEIDRDPNLQSYFRYLKTKFSPCEGEGTWPGNPFKGLSYWEKRKVAEEDKRIEE